MSTMIAAPFRSFPVVVTTTRRSRTGRGSFLVQSLHEIGTDRPLAEHVLDEVQEEPVLVPLGDLHPQPVEKRGEWDLGEGGYVANLR